MGPRRSVRDGERPDVAYCVSQIPGLMHYADPRLAAQGTAAVIGEPTGGWFWLPPWSLWQRWAKQGLAMLAANCALVFDLSPVSDPKRNPRRLSPLDTVDINIPQHNTRRSIS